MARLTPRQIVEELDKYIIGQDRAKRAVAITLRNRWRRQQLEPELRDEIAPKNIIMIGPTGVGKTEISRRLAKLTESPFLKVEASKYTEVGYVGRDVESMIRDLTAIGVGMVRSEMNAKVRKKAEDLAQEKLIDLLLPKHPTQRRPTDGEQMMKVQLQSEHTRGKFAQLLKEGQLEDRVVDLETKDRGFPTMIEIVSGSGLEEIGMNLKEMLPQGLFPQKSKKRRMKVSEAREVLIAEESEKLIDMDKVIKEAVYRVEQSGIIFLDEIDKIVGSGSKMGPDVSREGVQRDLLPIVEGSSVNTKYGIVRTDHILFLAAGAFHSSKPSDLIPEMQGRFPIRVELDSLTKKDFIRILTEPESALIKQYKALMLTEGIELEFTNTAIEEIAHTAWVVNEETENIGARRLQTVMEKLLEEISFEAPDLGKKKILINKNKVQEKLKDIVENKDLSRYIL